MFSLVRASQARRLCLARYPVQLNSIHTLKQYPDAINALNSLQSNYAIVNQIRKEGRSLNLVAIPEMIEWLRRMDYEQSDLDSLDIIHVAGTKGKGSTATFVSSILDQYRQSGRLNGVGLYTSPHLRYVRERIQINGQPVSETDFAEAFFELWDRFEASAQHEGKVMDAYAKPLYFRYLTLMAFHMFIKKGIGSAVFECGIGGEYDSTNIIRNPTVTAITSIGLDHVDMLGNTLGEIAWQKAGILKAGAPAYTSHQAPEAMQVLRERARERSVDLQVVDEHPELTSNQVKLGLDGSFQKTNASLAIEVAAAHLRKLGQSDLATDRLPPEFVRGLERAHLGGRCETRSEANISWHLDGAHTIESMQGAAQWFSECILADPDSRDSPMPSVLVFNQQTRNAPILLGEFLRKLATELGSAHKFSHVIFCTNRTFQSRGYSADLISMNTDDEAVENLSVQRSLADTWRTLEASNDTVQHQADVSVLTSIEEAVGMVRKIASETSTRIAGRTDQKCHVLVTGSVHLVGGALEVLET